MDQPLPGQRWISNSEPELGLGVIMKVQYGRLEIYFPAAKELRQYSQSAAPLRRVAFQVGDSVQTHNGDELLIESLREQDGLLFYRDAQGQEISEAQLADTISFSKPSERLLAGQADDLHTFDLRLEALEMQSRIRQSAVRGFCGGRIELLPHQISIASAVCNRLRARVLLADEVGLGKTIEACLILHRLHLTGRAERILILVPEPLVHQWFVELLRRFHLRFSILDEERCADAQLQDEQANAFAQSQLVICSMTLPCSDARRAEQLLQAGWDLVVVDEAHHLAAQDANLPRSLNGSYALIKALAAQVEHLLLLSATPAQLGPESHFARLQLLDPQRYADIEAFLEESHHYEQLADAVDQVLAGRKLDAAAKRAFARHSPLVQQLLQAAENGDEGQRQELIAALLDEFGTGRVMLRNTRAALKGFPKRVARLCPLEEDQDEWSAKVRWLAALLRQLGSQKVLLICQSRERVEQLHEALLREINVNVGLFHEGMTLLQRDRQAAFFAQEGEEGARLLMCSEIGSEGRNFQFAHHLVLMDLPADPEIIEQRIGRLDRIGQSHPIEIHVPFCLGSPQEALARWYHEGLQAFEHNLHGAHAIAEELAPLLAKTLAKPEAKSLKKLIKESKLCRERVVGQLARGQDRLLELSSFDAALAKRTIAAIEASDQDEAFEDFFIRLCDHFGLQVETMEQRSYVLKPGELITDAFPALPEEGLTCTFDRRHAIVRENITLLTPDHPLVRGALDLALSLQHGNCSFALWKGCGSEGLLLETHFVIECVAPAALHADRFLPPQPLRLVVNHSGADVGQDSAYLHAKLDKGSPGRLMEKPAVRQKLFPAMMAASQRLAQAQLDEVVQAASREASKHYQREIARLRDLAQRNPQGDVADAQSLESQLTQLLEVIGKSRLRLDSLMLVLQTKS